MAKANDHATVGKADPVGEFLLRLSVSSMNLVLLLFHLADYRNKVKVDILHQVFLNLQRPHRPDISEGGGSSSSNSYFIPLGGS